MRRAAAIAGAAFFGTLLLLALAACSTSKTAEHDLHAAQQADIVATTGLRIDTEQHAALDEHTIDTSGPGERVEETFTPDGGLVERVTTRWGPRTLEDWQTKSMGADEHLELDAGVTVRTFATIDEHDKSVATMKASGGCMLGLGFWGAIAIAAVLAVLVGVLKLRARAKALLP